MGNITRIITVKMKDDMIEELDMIANTLGISRSEAIREALRLYLVMHPLGKPRYMGIVKLES